jgi:3-oxoacyl-[acyl-carrier protein] reductase
MTDLSGKVALVTGSARGIGKAIAVRYAQLGADIAINYSGDESNASKTVAEIGEIGRDAIAVKADVTNLLKLNGFSHATVRENPRGGGAPICIDPTRHWGRR